ncbi:hypothetical protein A3Q56_04938 [Intoshia linei]|uniref:Uncharacterized protein n=1 Tax=Intoshia linei TaxID=1819745 RepID=A0A177B118_9BILA|nr:hypothetical protein A3Q56_04938 [Intoshia linei]
MSNINYHLSQTKKFTRRVSRMFSFSRTPRLNKHFSRSFLMGHKKRHITTSSTNGQADGFDSMSSCSNQDKISIASTSKAEHLGYHKCDFKKPDDKFNVNENETFVQENDSVKSFNIIPIFNDDIDIPNKEHL